MEDMLLVLVQDPRLPPSPARGGGRAILDVFSYGQLGKGVRVRNWLSIRIDRSVMSTTLSVVVWPDPG